MRETHTIYKYIKKEIKSNLIAPALLTNVIKACQKAMDTKFPILISGDQGVGKSFGVQYFAYQNKIDITMINASVVLRKKSGQILIRAEMLRPNKKIKFLIIDEVEKDTNIKFLTRMVEINRKTSFKTNVIMICITNHYWKLGALTNTFGAFHHQIKAPYIRSMGKALRDLDVEYSGPLIRDLRFFRGILLNPNTQKSPAISEDTFSAIQTFLSRNIRDRDFRATEVSLNAPFWKWILANFHHGTFMYVIEDKSGEKRNSFPKHNTAMFHNACEYLSLADTYQSKDMLEFILPSGMQKPYLQHPSALSKRNRK